MVLFVCVCIVFMNLFICSPWLPQLPSEKDCFINTGRDGSESTLRTCAHSILICWNLWKTQKTPNKQNKLTLMPFSLNQGACSARSYNHMMLYRGHLLLLRLLRLQHDGCYVQWNSYRLMTITLTSTCSVMRRRRVSTRRFQPGPIAAYKWAKLKMEST